MNSRRRSTRVFAVLGISSVLASTFAVDGMGRPTEINVAMVGVFRR
jgi:hypothetical protein